MPFGISPAPEEFQRRLNIALQGLDGVMPIFDDILIFGAGDTEAEAMADHDAKLRALMQRCREKGIKLNKEKLKLRCKEVPFMGHVISANGLKADPTKIQGIQEMPTRLASKTWNVSSVWPTTCNAVRPEFVGSYSTTPRSSKGR